GQPRGGVRDLRRRAPPHVLPQPLLGAPLPALLPGAPAGLAPRRWGAPALAGESMPGRPITGRGTRPSVPPPVGALFLRLVHEEAPEAAPHDVEDAAAGLLHEALRARVAQGEPRGVRDVRVALLRLGGHLVQALVVELERDVHALVAVHHGHRLGLPEAEPLAQAHRRGGVQERRVEGPSAGAPPQAERQPDEARHRVLRRHGRGEPDVVHEVVVRVALERAFPPEAILPRHGEQPASIATLEAVCAPATSAALASAVAAKRNPPTHVDRRPKASHVNGLTPRTRSVIPPPTSTMTKLMSIISQSQGTSGPHKPDVLCAYLP